MLKYSHVALKITNLKEPTGRDVTKHLGIAPTKIQKVKGHVGTKETLLYIWRLDSPKDQNFAPVVRLEALLDVIAPFSEKLISLDSRYSRLIDLVFHMTPQREDGTINGEFDWFMMSPPLMSKMGAWNLPFSYEKFWYEEKFYKIRMESLLEH